MELICPSCEARYAIPDGSIGEKGRQVSCMNCGHGWHAYPPLVLGAEDAAVSPAAGMQWRDPEAMPTAPPARPSIPGMTDAAPAAAAPAKSRSAVNRSEQLAEIREMLAEVQSEDRAAAARSDQRVPMQSEPTLVAPAAGFAATLDDRAATSSTQNTFRDATRVAPEQPEPPRGDYDASLREDDDDDDVDPLRRRMEMHDTSTKASAKPTDVKRLRRTHERR
ncbi:MAG: zinc-ribbon domain-containing protein, partial [Pseudomonadota bacterium]